MDYLWNADHLSRSKFSFEHLAYCSATFDWLLRYMMVHSIFVIKLREGRGIILVEPLNEIFYHLTRAHEPLLSIAIRFETLSGTIRLNCTTSPCGGRGATLGYRERRPPAMSEGDLK